MQQYVHTKTRNRLTVEKVQQEMFIKCIHPKSKGLKILPDSDEDIDLLSNNSQNNESFEFLSHSESEDYLEEDFREEIKENFE